MFVSPVATGNLGLRGRPRHNLPVLTAHSYFLAITFHSLDVAGDSQ